MDLTYSVTLLTRAIMLARGGATPEQWRAWADEAQAWMNDLDAVTG